MFRTEVEERLCSEVLSELHSAVPLMKNVKYCSVLLTHLNYKLFGYSQALVRQEALSPLLTKCA